MRSKLFFILRFLYEKLYAYLKNYYSKVFWRSQSCFISF